MSYLRMVTMYGALVLIPLAASGDERSLTVESADGQVTAFSVADLDALPQVSFETSTIWTDDTATFTGVSLSRLLEVAEASGTTLRMTALNDYAVDMPIAEIGEKYPIIATRMDGAEMSVREKGPYWVVFPYDADPSYQTETIYARSVWQLSALSVMN